MEIYLYGNKMVVSLDGSINLKSVEIQDNDELRPKHEPVVSKKGDRLSVDIGAIKHPMLDVHYIEWILLEWDTGFAVKKLYPGMEPRAEFTVSDNLKRVYCFCNIHGLWMKEL